MAPKSSRVAIINEKNPYEAATQVLRLVQDDYTVVPDHKIIIKPNIVRPVSPMRGITTDVRVVEAIIAHLREKGVEEIVIAEGGNPRTDKAFEKLGYKALAKEQSIGLVNLNKDEYKTIHIENALALKKVKIAETILGCDGIINVPKLKIHHMAQVTLSLKNLMGVIVDNRGLVMHDRLDAKIVDLASVFKPLLNVVDGVVGAEKDEVIGDPVRSNIVLAGVDMVSVDAVGSAVMGQDPRGIRHIQMAADRGLGVAELGSIVVLGDSIDKVMKKYSIEYSDKKLETYGLAHPLTEEDITHMKSSFANRDPQVQDPYA